MKRIAVTNAVTEQKKDNAPSAGKLSAPLVEKNARQQKLNDALISAAARGNLQDVKMLVAQGADVNYKNDIGVTALYYAQYHSYEDVTKFLKEKIKNSGCEKA